MALQSELRWGAGHDSAFSVIIDFDMKTPSDFTGAVPKFYLVAAVAVEKMVRNDDGSTLTRVMRGVESTFRGGKGVRDDNDMVSI